MDYSLRYVPVTSRLSDTARPAGPGRFFCFEQAQDMTRHGHGFMTRKGLAGDSSSRPPPGRAAPGLVGS